MIQARGPRITGSRLRRGCSQLGAVAERRSRDPARLRVAPGGIEFTARNGGPRDTDARCTLRARPAVQSGDDHRTCRPRANRSSDGTAGRNALPAELHRESRSSADSTPGPARVSTVIASQMWTITSALSQALSSAAGAGELLVRPSSPPSGGLSTLLFVSLLA